MAVFTLYILKSAKTGKFYIGQTNDLEHRLNQHENSMTGFGRRNKDIQLVYKNNFNSRQEARKIENFIKRQKSHKFIAKLINGAYNIPR